MNNPTQLQIHGNLLFSNRSNLGTYYHLALSLLKSTMMLVANS